MTLLQYQRHDNSKIPFCSTVVEKVSAVKDTFYNFIQTDKPIYKPGEKLQFRVLTVDRELKPYHRNNLEIKIVDINNTTQETISNQAGQYKGVFTGSHVISLSAALGNWRIEVIVDKKPELITSKSFIVEKYTLPLFEVYIELENKHLLFSNELKITIYAKYSFGDYVAGDAIIIITDTTNKHEYYNKITKNINQNDILSLRLDKIGINKDGEYKIFVEFSESQSGISFNKSATFYAHQSLKYKLSVFHPEKYLTDFPFSMEIYVMDWKNNRINNHIDMVDVTFKYQTINGTIGNVFYNEKINQGICNCEFRVPKNVSKLFVEVRFSNSLPYYADIMKGSVSVGINKLKVVYSPEQ